MNELEELHTEIKGSLARLRKDMTDYVIPNAFQEGLSVQIAEAERRLTAIQTVTDARTVRSQLDATVSQWNAATRRQHAVFDGHTDQVDAVTFSPDGALLVSSSEDKTLRVWDVASGRERTQVHSHNPGVKTIAFNPDGATLAYSSGHIIYFWDVADNRQFARLEESGLVTAIAYSPDGAK